MFGRALLAIAVLGTAHLLTTVLAADESATRRAPTLGERLEQFRQELTREGKSVGGPAPQETRRADSPFSADRKLGGGNRPRTNAAPDRNTNVREEPTPTPAAPKGQPTAVTAPKNAPPALHAPNGITRPPLEAQSARRAKPGAVSTPPSRVDIELEEDEAGIEPLSPFSRVEPKQTPTPAPAQEVELAEPEPEPESEPVFEPQVSSPPPAAAPRGGAPKPVPLALRAMPGAVQRTPEVARSVPTMPIERNAPPGNQPSFPTDRPAFPPERSAGPEGNVLFTTQGPVISVEASGPRKVMIGKEAEFVVRVNNAGSAANNVIVSMNIPSDADVVSTQATNGSAQAPAPSEHREPMEWKVPRLEARSSETLRLKLIPRKSTPLDLAIHWTFTPETSQALVEVQEPKLHMTISGPEEVHFGQSKIYRLTLSNPGNGDTENVVVALLPVGRASEGIASHRLGTLHAGDVKTIDIELTARQAGALVIKAQAYADAGLRTEAVQQVLVRRANLQLEVESPKVKYAGTAATYKLKVTNAGDAVADNVQVSAVLPSDAKYISATAGGRHEPQQGRVNWSVGSIAPGSQRTLEMQCSLLTPGENRMQFMSMGEGDISASATSNTRVEALADLKLEVRDPQGPIAVGEAAVYEVHVRNRGTKAAQNVELTVFFSDGLEATSVDGPPHEIAAGQVVFRSLPSLSAGEVAVFKISTRADRPGNHVFRAEVVCHALDMKLAAEEATRFYGDEHAVGLDPEPAPLSSRGASELNPFAPRAANEPTLARPQELFPLESPEEQ